MCYNIMKPEFTLRHRFLLGQTANGLSQSSELELDCPDTLTKIHRLTDVLMSYLWCCHCLLSSEYIKLEQAENLILC